MSRIFVKLNPCFLRRLFFAGLGTAALAGIVVVACGVWVRHKSAPYIYRSIAQVPKEPVAIVLGALVFPNGQVSPVLRGRIDAAVALYKAGKVSKLLMTGDNGSNRYDEVTPMKKYAMAAGVPDVDIIRDYAGFRTFDSCYRAKHVFCVERAVIVTQDFHLSRAVYLARQMGISAVGFVAQDNLTKHDLNALKRRESWAMFLAVLDANSPWKHPRYTGRVEPLMDNRVGR
jgi:vancomycin permeability regulator SanA